MKKHSSGFSLVELSIALVIIGLIAGTIVGAKQLIRNAHIGTIVKNKGMLDQAIAGFYDRYGQLPGDMNNATDHWTGVVNGNGDFILTTGGAFVAGNAREDLQLWTHLAKAGYISGEYSGIMETSFLQLNVNTFEIAPKTAVQVYRMPLGDHLYRYIIGGLITHASGVKELANSTTATTVPEALTPTEIWQIDQKYDDGVSGTGQIVRANIALSCPYDTPAQREARAKCIFGWAPSWGKLLVN